MWSWLSLPEVGTVLTFAQASWFTESIHPCWFAQPLCSQYVFQGFRGPHCFPSAGLGSELRLSEIKVSGPV